MNDGFVAGSSVAIACAVAAQSSERTRHLLNEVASGTPVVVPVLWMFEIANSLLVLVRRKRIHPEQCAKARRGLGRLSPVVDEEGPRFALGEISGLAERMNLSVYDATYLELALRRRLPLASRDGALNRAAKLSGIQTLF